MGVPETLALTAGLLVVTAAGVTIAVLAVVHPNADVRRRAIAILTWLFTGRRPKGF